MAPFGYRFGDFRLAPAARELWLDERLVALPPKSLDCLIYLVEHRERAIGRDELISAVWGRTEVSDDVLAQTLLRARRAVGDTGNDQRAIRTVPRFGYRWILPVEEIPQARAQARADIEASDPVPIDAAPLAPAGKVLPPSAAHARNLRLLAIGIALLIAAGVALWLVRARHDVATTADDHAVLVLPVDVSGGDQQSSWIRLGAMDYIASSLRERTPLKVLPSEQTLLLAGPGTDPSDASTLHRLEVATGTRYILAPHATYSGGAWSFVLDTYHHDGVQSYEARAASPLDAANLAITRFVTTLGVRAATPAATTAATELVQRMDAAMLAGDLAEAHRLVDTTPETLKGDPAVRVRTGQIAFRAGQLDAATAQFEPLVTDAALAADLRAQVQMGLGAVAVRRADFESAERNYSAAIATLSGARDDPNLLGTAYSGRAVANGARGLPAANDFARARVELERAGNRIGAATVDVNLALVEFRRAHYDAASAAFDRSIDIFNRFDVRDDLAAALIGKANLQLTLLDAAGALATSERTTALAQQLENPILRRHVLTVRVQALLANGALAAASRLLDDLDEKARDHPEIGWLRARLALERGDAVAASALIGEAIRQQNDGTVASIAASDFALVAAVALRRGGDAATVERALEFLKSTEAASSATDQVRVVELAQATLAASRSDPSAATHFDAAMAEADRNAAPDAIAGTAVAELVWLLARPDLDQAKSIAGRLATFAERDYESARALAAFYRATGDVERTKSAEANVRKLAGERDPSAPI